MGRAAAGYGLQMFPVSRLRIPKIPDDLFLKTALFYNMVSSRPEDISSGKGFPGLRLQDA